MPLYILRLVRVGLLGYYPSVALKVYCVFQYLAQDHFKIFRIVDESETEIEAFIILFY